MKTMIIAAGALALTSTAAFAQSAYQPGYSEPMIQSEPGVEPAGATPGYVSPSANTAYPAVDDGLHTPAAGFSAQSATEAGASTPNMGAGTSRSNAANSG